jgi:hypothetical protein
LLPSAVLKVFCHRFGVRPNLANNRSVGLDAAHQTREIPRPLERCRAVGFVVVFALDHVTHRVNPESVNAMIKPKLCTLVHGGNNLWVAPI